MLGLKLSLVSKRGHWCHLVIISHDDCAKWRGFWGDLESWILPIFFQLSNLHCGHHMIVLMPMKQAWRVWVNKSHKYNIKAFKSRKQKWSKTQVGAWKSWKYEIILALLVTNKIFLNANYIYGYGTTRVKSVSLNDAYKCHSTSRGHGL